MYDANELWMRRLSCIYTDLFVNYLLKADKRATGASRVAAEMSLVHNTLIRGINAVYLQCVNVGERGSAKDKMDFAWFARQWSSFLNHHHSLEEDTLFPEINRLSGVADFMDASLEEHEVFHTGVHGFDEYLAKVTAGEEPYDGKKLKSIIDSFMPALETHLANEIKTLLRLAEYEDKVNWPEWFDKRVGEQAKKLLDSPDYKVSNSIRCDIRRWTLTGRCPADKHYPACSDTPRQAVWRWCLGTFPSRAVVCPSDAEVALCSYA